MLQVQLVFVSVTLAPPVATMGFPSSWQFSNFTLHRPWHTIVVPAPPTATSADRIRIEYATHGPN